MFAVLKEGGKQYHVKQGDVIRVERLEEEVGSTVKLHNGVSVGDKIGTPCLEKGAVEAIILEHTRTEKVIVFKKKRRQNYRRKNGHRQNITVLRIGKIVG